MLLCKRIRVKSLQQAGILQLQRVLHPALRTKQQRLQRQAIRVIYQTFQLQEDL